MSAVVKFGINAPLPLYQAARARLLQGLASRAYPPGTALPPEKTLASQFGISIGTLRKAVDELVSEGILIRQQGRGTFVASHDQDRLLYYFFHIVPFDGIKTSYPVVSLLRFERQRADEEMASKLAVANGAGIISLRNTLSLNGTVVVVDDIALPAAKFSRLTEARVRNRPSTLYHLYQEAYGLSVAHTSERLRAVAATADIAQLFNLTTGAPVLSIRRVALGYQRDPIEWRVSHVDTSAHEYFSELV